MTELEAYEKSLTLDALKESAQQCLRCHWEGHTLVFCGVHKAVFHRLCEGGAA